MKQQSLLITQESVCIIHKININGTYTLNNVEHYYIILFVLAAITAWFGAIRSNVKQFTYSASCTSMYYKTK